MTKTRHLHLAAEYVVLGPIIDLESVAEAIGSLPLPPCLPAGPADPQVTASVPTTRIRVWLRSDGARITEVSDCQGAVVTVLRTPERLRPAA